MTGYTGLTERQQIWKRLARSLAQAPASSVRNRRRDRGPASNAVAVAMTVGFVIVLGGEERAELERRVACCPHQFSA